MAAAGTAGTAGTAGGAGKRRASLSRQITHEGYLTKKGAMRQNWVRRWFRLDAKNKQLLYYKSSTGEELKGVIELVGSIATAGGGNHQMEIRNTATKRVYHIRAESENDLAAWLLQMKQVTEQGHIEDEDVVGELKSGASKTLTDEQYEKFKSELEGGHISLIIHPRGASSSVEFVNIELIKEQHAFAWGGKLTHTGRVGGSSILLTDMTVAVDVSQVGGASAKQKRASVSAPPCFFCLMDREKTVVVETPSQRERDRFVQGLTRLSGELKLVGSQRLARRVSKRASVSVHAKKTGSTKRMSTIDGLGTAVEAEKRRQSQRAGGANALTADNLAALEQLEQLSSPNKSGKATRRLSARKSVKPAKKPVAKPEDDEDAKLRMYFESQKQ
jgi:hypothetical protein